MTCREENIFFRYTHFFHEILITILRIIRILIWLITQTCSTYVCVELGTVNLTASQSCTVRYPNAVKFHVFRRPSAGAAFIKQSIRLGNQPLTQFFQLTHCQAHYVLVTRRNNTVPDLCARVRVLLCQ